LKGRIIFAAVAFIAGFPGKKEFSFPERNNEKRDKDKRQVKGGDSVSTEVLEIPADQKITPPDPATEIKVKAIYDFGNLLFEEKDYIEALMQFYIIIHDFPDSQYYEGACAMREACRRMLLFHDERKRQKVYARPLSFNQDSNKGCLGILSIIGALLLIAVISG